MANVAEQVRTQIEARRRELRPLAEEAAQLEALLAAWEHDLPRSSPPPRRARASRPERRAPGARRQSVAEREATILAVLGRRPGIEPTALAQEVGLSRVRLAQLLKPLEQTGRVTRAQGGLFAGTGRHEPAQPAHQDQSENDPHGEHPRVDEQW